MAGAMILKTRRLEGWLSLMRLTHAAVVLQKGQLDPCLQAATFTDALATHSTG